MSSSFPPQQQQVQTAASDQKNKNEEYNLQRQERFRNLNVEALGLLKSGNFGGAFTQWRQTFQDICEIPQEEPQTSVSSVSQQQQQECVRTVEINADSVYRINARACPETLFPMFCRAFLVTSNASSASATTSVNAISRLIDSTVVLYNVGFANQLAAMMNDAKQRLCRLKHAYCYYSNAYKRLTYLLQLQDFSSHPSYPMMLVLALAIYINKGHLHAYLLQYKELQQCRERIVATHKLLSSTIKAWPSSSAFRPLPTRGDTVYIFLTVFASTTLCIYNQTAPMA